MTLSNSIRAALIIRRPWIDLLLSGEKTWEMRSNRTNVRGRIGLVEQGSGVVVGVAEITDSPRPLSETEMLSTQEFHCIPEHMICDGSVGKWRYPWVLNSIARLKHPVRYKHQPGAVIWAKLDDQCRREIESQLTDDGGVSRRSELPPAATTPRQAAVASAQHPVPSPSKAEPKVAGVGSTLVPVAKDGSWFGHHLSRAGYYTIGAKGEERKVGGFETALCELRGMQTARWRRPNAKGNWGIVAAVRWDTIPPDGGC